MSERIEGTIVLDGLVEGRLPPDEGYVERLRDWTRLLGRLGLGVDLEVDGAHFSLLGRPTACPVAALGERPADRIRDALAQLVDAFESPGEAEFFSTLRSVEYAPGEEIQTVYIVRPDGSVDAPQRRVPAKTQPPAPALSRKERLRVVGTSVLVLAALFGISSLFVDWGAHLERLWHNVTPLDVATLQVDAVLYDEYVDVVGRERAGASEFVELVLRRKAAYPTTPQAVARALAGAQGDHERRLVLEALAKGYVLFEVFAEDGAFLRSSVLRVAGLQAKEEIKVLVPVPRDPRPARIVLRY